MDALHAKRPLHPLVCIGSSLATLICGLLLAKHALFPLFLLALCLLYTAFGLGQVALKGVLVFLPVCALFAAFSLLLQRNPTTALQMAGRVMLVGVSAIPMVSLPPIHLTRCLSQMGCPKGITLGMLIAVRFVPVVASEIARVREAMRTRGVRVSFYRAFLIPVMIRFISMSETMSLSLETRGFALDDRPVSAYETVRFVPRDALYCAILLLLLCAIILTKELTL